MYNYLMQQIMSEKTRKRLKVNCSHYDVEQLESELKQFPESMYEDWLENRALFVSRMYYQRIPRKAIWRFISGIAFVEMMKEGADNSTRLSSMELVDTALSMEISVMQATELVLSRINDNRNHVFDEELDRLRKAKDAKVAKSAEPQKIGQMIATQNLIGNGDDLRALLNSKVGKKLLEMI